MMFKQHLLAGSATGIITGATAWYITKNPIAGLAFAGITIAGSLAPDIDVGSIPSRWFARIGIVLCLVMMYTGQPEYAAWTGTIYMALSAGKHRGFTHKWILVIACFIVGWISIAYPQYKDYWWAIPLGAGLATHLCLDKIPPYKII